MAILKLEDVSKDFSGFQVLCRIFLEIGAGERHAVIGPNGAGKSTLFNLVTGLYKPSEGKIWFHGQDIAGLPIHKISRLGLSRSFQITNIFPGMTVFENVRNAAVSKLNRRLNWNSSLNASVKIRQEAERFIELLDLAAFRNVAASHLSYGVQRQLELALTLVQDPILVLLDEPTAGLDSDETRRIVQLIKQVTVGKTLVVIEHDMDVVFSLADRITVLVNGQVLVTGAPDEVRQNEKVKEAYLQRKVACFSR
jgi:branched-chain amino acid transport system ATP-binding protein